jgi:4-aminobutyrate aminotransferase-like enzyme
VSRLVSEGLLADPEVAAARRALLAALARHQAALDGVRPPDPERAVAYAEAIAALEGLRGGPLLLPFLASGIGHGPLVELADGSVKYDMINGIGVHHLGHSHPALAEAALEAALADTIMQGNLQQDETAIAFSALLLELAGRGGAELAHCFVASSGVMAGENALKIALQHHSPASRLLAFEGNFAGRTLAFAQITDKASYRDGLPEVLQVDFVPFLDPERPAESAERALAVLRGHLGRHPRRHAAMVFELVLGEGGVHAGSRDFHLPLMQACREAGVGVLVDEIQTFGRTPQPFAFQHYGLDGLVDVVWVGKATQACATLFRADYRPRPGLVAQTYTASTAAIRGGLAVMRHLRDGGYFGADGRIARLHERFRAGLEELAARHPGQIRGPWGIGAMIGFTPLDGSAERVGALVRDLFHRGVISSTAGHDPTRVRFLAPVGATEDRHVAEVLAIVDAALAAAG